MPGPPPKPAALRLLNGNPSGRPIAEQPAFEICETPPVWLDGEAKEIWAQVAPMLTVVKVLTEADINALGRYCHLLATWIKLATIVEKTGTAYATFEKHKVTTDITHPDGRREIKTFYERVQTGMKTLPQARHYQTISESLTRLEAQFGMTPSSRAKIKIGEAKLDDPAFDDSDLR